MLALDALVLRDPMIGLPLLRSAPSALLAACPTAENRRWFAGQARCRCPLTRWTEMNVQRTEFVQTYLAHLHCHPSRTPPRSSILHTHPTRTNLSQEQPCDVVCEGASRFATLLLAHPPFARALRLLALLHSHFPQHFPAQALYSHSSRDRLPAMGSQGCRCRRSLRLMNSWKVTCQLLRRCRLQLA